MWFVRAGIHSHDEFTSHKQRKCCYKHCCLIYQNTCFWLRPNGLSRCFVSHMDQKLTNTITHKCGFTHWWGSKWKISQSPYGFWTPPPPSWLSINTKRDSVIGNVANTVWGMWDRVWNDNHYACCDSLRANISLAAGYFCPRAPVCMSQANT